MKYNNKKLFLLTIIGVFTFLFAMQIVAAQPAAADTTGPETVDKTIDFLLRINLLPDTLDTFVGEGNSAKLLWIFLSIFGLLITFLIAADLLMLVSPWSDYINWLIAGGVMIVFVISDVYRQVLAWSYLSMALIIGGGGILALLLTGVLFIAAIYFLFFGYGEWFAGFVEGVRARKKMLRSHKKATEGISEVVEGTRVLRAAGKAVNKNNDTV